MKKKINITMQVTYEVSMEIEVENDVLESLEYVQDNYPRAINSSHVDLDNSLTTAYEWMVDNCHEYDSVSWEVEIQDLIVEE